MRTSRPSPAEPAITKRANDAATGVLGLTRSSVLMGGNKQVFLRCIARALREGSIYIPKETGSVAWKFPTNFLDLSKLETAGLWALPLDGPYCSST